MSSCCQKISVGREGIFFFFEKYFFLKSRLFLWCYSISYKMNQQWFYHIIYTLWVIKSKNTNGRSIVNGNTNIFALIFSVTSPDKMRKKTSLPGENFFFIWKFSPGRSSGNGFFFYFCLMISLRSWLCTILKSTGSCSIEFKDIEIIWNTNDMNVCGGD